MNLQTIAERKAAGAALRAQTPRSSHAAWQLPPDRADPIAILQAQGQTRIAALLPLRTARMQASAFAFLRGSAAIMAADLATMPSSGLCVQAAGDCHLANFGTFRSPEGLAVFDLNDFDETLPAPFEWDVKRLATSFVLSGREAKLSAKECRALAVTATAAYRVQIAALSGLSPLGIWAARINLPEAIAAIDNSKLRARAQVRLKSAMDDATGHYGLIEAAGATWRIKMKPPTIRPVPATEIDAGALFARYATTLPAEIRALLDRYSLTDVAFKVVGIGSVGTYCAIALFTTADGQALILQLKQAEQSVLAACAGASEYNHQGERVVQGQRLLQATPDPFLGWTEGGGREFYVRQLKDQRLAAIGTDISEALPFYAGLCGRTLARGHARSGDAAAIAGYLGAGDQMDEAIGDFAVAYADQSTADWQAIRAAIGDGRLAA